MTVEEVMAMKEWWQRRHYDVVVGGVDVRLGLEIVKDEDSLGISGSVLSHKTKP